MESREQKERREEASRTGSPVPAQEGTACEPEQLIDIALVDSFPASDPPVWTLGREEQPQWEKGGGPAAGQQGYQPWLEGGEESGRRDHKEQLIRRYYGAFQSGDLSQVFATLAPNVKVHIPESLPYGGVYDGHEGFKNFVSKSGTLVNLRVVVDRYFDGGAADAFTLVTLCGLHAKKASAPHIDMPLLERFSVKDGKIQELWVFYWDTAVVKQILEER
jgi:ketosteroid isomerase-like protein